MTTASAQTVTEYLDGVAEPYRADARQLHKLIRATVPELRPFLISGMIGYGAHHYRYATGREGDTFVVDLGKSCIRFRRLSDLDQTTIIAVLRSAGKAATERKAT